MCERRGRGAVDHAADRRIRGESDPADGLARCEADLRGAAYGSEFFGMAVGNDKPSLECKNPTNALPRPILICRGK